jgi:hypothetical protein
LIFEGIDGCLIW